jgi:ketol-acid reductoisomerase
MVLSAAQEAVLDLFIEQSVGPYLGMALQLAFEVGTGAGLPAEAMVLELYMSGELARTVQGFAEQGFFQAVRGHGLAATYGGYLGTLALDTEAMRRRFTEVLDQRVRAVLGPDAPGLAVPEPDG